MVEVRQLQEWIKTRFLNFFVRVWLAAVVDSDVDWARNVLVSSPKLRPICTTSKKDKVNNFCLDFPRSVSLDDIARTLWHHLTQEWAQTLGILSTSKTGHLFEMWQLPRMTFSFKLHGYPMSSGQRCSRANSPSLTTKENTYFWWACTGCLLRLRIMFHPLFAYEECCK